MEGGETAAGMLLCGGREDGACEAADEADDTADDTADDEGAAQDASASIQQSITVQSVKISVFVFMCNILFLVVAPASRLHGK